jgi:hypothetical protein
MNGAIHPSEPVWVNGRPTPPAEIRPGDRIDSTGTRRPMVTKVVRGGGKGTVWLYGASGARIRCLRDQRVQLSVGGRIRYKRAEKVAPGDFMMGLVSGRVCVDPVVAIRVVEESVPAIYLEMPSVSLVSEEGLLCRPVS